jgi:hypothetical protein
MPVNLEIDRIEAGSWRTRCQCSAASSMMYFSRFASWESSVARSYFAWMAFNSAGASSARTKEAVPITDQTTKFLTALRMIRS